MPGPIIDQWVGFEGYDMLGAPSERMSSLGSFLDEITAGVGDLDQ